MLRYDEEPRLRRQLAGAQLTLKLDLRFGEYLDSAFLGYLGGTLYELLALEGVLLADTRKVLRSECRDTFEFNLFLRRAQGVAD